LIQRFALLDRRSNEDNLENSEYNQERIKQENLSEYQSKEKFEELIKLKSNEVNETFMNIYKAIKSLENNNDYYKSEKELQEELQLLNLENNKHVENLSAAIEITGI